MKKNSLNCNVLQEGLNSLYKCASFINFMYITKVKKTLLPDDRKMLFPTSFKMFLLPRKCLKCYCSSNTMYLKYS